ncbi:MAG: DsrE family protein [Gammaproteobacteria bacterium]|nr:DsrE family protein [Gammaproteobacteria bacterium]
MKSYTEKYSVILFITSIFLTMATHGNDKTYSPARVVFNVSSANIKLLNHTLDRASLLQNIYNNDPISTSIVIVIHGNAIPSFTHIKQQNHQLINRAKDLSMSDIIEFRLCAASARMHGLHKSDFSGFINIIPMADAEIIELQNSGYAYIN